MCVRHFTPPLFPSWTSLIPQTSAQTFDALYGAHCRVLLDSQEYQGRIILPNRSITNFLILKDRVLRVDLRFGRLYIRRFSTKPTVGMKITGGTRGARGWSYRYQENAEEPVGLLRMQS